MLIHNLADTEVTELRAAAVLATSVSGSVTGIACADVNEVDFEIIVVNDTNITEIKVQAEASSDNTNWVVLQQESSGVLTDMVYTRAITADGQRLLITVPARLRFVRIQLYVSAGTGVSSSVSVQAIRRRRN
ncbi:MAG TPA: hypothetical protein DG761_01180 [Gammaproteobacteria bacterium]|nr:hypothetical protein [Gammaproteobacteria bacterium]